MINFLSKTFIKDYDKYDDPKVRGRYGIFCNLINIILNLLMAGFKIVVGSITNSVAILADGFNNLSDVASNVVTLVGFTLSSKNPDKEHPFGHGRMEYLSSLGIAILIIFVGLQTLWNSIIHIITPKPVYFSYVAVVVLITSILIKYLMGRFNFIVGSKIKSSTLIAAGKDSKVDVLTTTVTLIALIASLYTDLPIDEILGSIVSLIILKTGYEIAKDTIASLLGSAPDEGLLKELSHFVSSYERVLGTHDLMIHDYGPGRKYLTIHVEVNKNEEMMDIHDLIDNIERDIYDKFKIKTTIHLDPVDLDDEFTHKMKIKTNMIITSINANYSIHDFRIRRYDNDVTLIFDVTIPAEDTTSHHKLIKQIDDEIKNYDPKFNTLIQIDHSYT